MKTIPVPEWIEQHFPKGKRREGYRFLKNRRIKVVKELREIVQKRKMWVMCIDESVKPE